MGGGVFYGAISRTDEIAVKYYSHLPVLLHDIDPHVDQSRDLLASIIEDDPNHVVVGHADLTDPVPDGIVADYQTDGRVLVIARSSFDSIGDLARCLETD